MHGAAPAGPSPLLSNNSQTRVFTCQGRGDAARRCPKLGSPAACSHPDRTSSDTLFTSRHIAFDKQHNNRFPTCPTTPSRAPAPAVALLRLISSKAAPPEIDFRRGNARFLGMLLEVPPAGNQQPRLKALPTHVFMSPCQTVIKHLGSCRLFIGSNLP
jgi:hypothetical protein